MGKRHIQRRGSSSFEISPSQGGILIFCFLKRERAAVQETLHMIDDIVQERKRQLGEHAEHEANCSVEFVTDDLEQELASLRKKSSTFSNYEQVQVGGIDCICFITPKKQPGNPITGPGIGGDEAILASSILGQSDPLSPLAICYAIWEKILSGSLNRQRILDDIEIAENPPLLATSSQIQHHGLKSVQRLIPLERTCHANISEIKKMMEHVLFVQHATIFQRGSSSQPILPHHQTSYGIFVQSRHHTSISKGDIITCIADLIQSSHCVLSEANGSDTVQPTMLYVDLKEPRISICVELIKGICGASVIIDYITRYKRGNVQLQ